MIFGMFILLCPGLQREPQLLNSFFTGFNGLFTVTTEVVGSFSQLGYGLIDFLNCPCDPRVFGGLLPYFLPIFL